MPPRVLVVIQARMGSSRLPGKVVADLAGQPMLGLQLARLGTLASDRIVVATTDRPLDDPVEDLATAAGVPVVRGSESDVLSRFGLALARYEADVVVRLTGDCPLSDPGLVGDVVDLHRRMGVDYASNVHPRSFPKGLDVEVVTAAGLRTAVEDATDPYDREHVTPYLYRHPERFSTANLAADQDHSQLWWTVDTAEDLERVRRIVDLLDDPVHATWREILVAAGHIT